MEEKRTQIHDFFRTISSRGNASRTFSTSAIRQAISSIFGVNEKGFTLIELLVVIALLGILTATAMFLINPGFQLQKSRDAKRKSDIRIIQSALELYRSDQGAYPSSTANIVANCPSGAPTSLQDPNCSTTTYLQTIPKDPRTGSNYFYCTSASCGAPTNGYSIFACLENSKDADKLTPALSDSTSVGCTSITSAVYKATNP